MAGVNEVMSDRQMQAVLIGDFYASYRFSQGDGRLQGVLVSALGEVYRDTWPAEAVTRIGGVALDAEAAILQLYEPRSHVGVTDERRYQEFRARWADFSRRLTAGHTIIPAAAQRSRIVRGMIARDERFTDNLVDFPEGRPSTKRTDPWESHVREYLLDGRPTGSDAFDHIFSRLRANTLRYGLPLFTGNVQVAWEQHHPGQPFFPPAYEAAFFQDASQLARRRVKAGLWLGRLLHASTPVCYST